MSSNTDEVVAHAAAAGEDLASLAAFQELILERSHDLITIMDPGGTIVYGSPSWRSLGMDPDQIVGKAALDFVHPEDVDVAQLQDTDAGAEGPFIQKPFTPAQLVEKVSSVLAG